MTLMRSLFAQGWNLTITSVGTVLGFALRFGVQRRWLYFPFVSQMLSVVPFSFGWKLRRAAYARLLPSIGEDAVLHFGVLIEDERSTIGRDVWVSPGCYLDYVKLEDSVLIGPQAVVLSGGHHHRFEDLSLPIKHQGNNKKEPLRVERGVWIGARAVVMADVGHDAIVGAGAVVTRPVPPRGVVAGNPARLLRIRSEDREDNLEPTVPAP